MIKTALQVLSYVTKSLTEAHECYVVTIIVVSVFRKAKASSAVSEARLSKYLNMPNTASLQLVFRSFLYRFGLRSHMKSTAHMLPR
jgi:hypothetical protein